MSDRYEIYKIKQVLNQGLERIDTPIVARLEKARRSALAVYPQPVAHSIANVATVGGWFNKFDRAHSVRRLGAGVIALMMGVGLLTYWQMANQPNEDDIDAVLLADELPIETYLDNGFNEWLKL